MKDRLSARPRSSPRCPSKAGRFARSAAIAEGRRIHKVDQLVAKFGGQANKWVKMSAVDAAGREIHWYQHPGIGKVGIKLAGQPDPF